ncbi:Ig-like domain-containing protein [Candidatus Uhrbacteria bacterium]|nr:Ig-like domain-containing protein [Candidatus Uhrbacteria bacterium]
MRSYSIIQNAISLKKLICGGLLLAVSLALLTAIEARAQTFNLRVKLIDELGLPLPASTPPSFTVNNCSATAPRIEATKSLGDGIFELAIVVDGSDKTCDLSVTSSQYLHTTPVSTGDLGAGLQDKTGSPITLYYRLRVLVKDSAGSSVSDAVVHHAGFSPQRASGGIYYFATSASGALIVEKTGFVTENGAQNTQLQNIAPGTSSQVTTVELRGTNFCASGNSVAAGTSVTCAVASPTFTAEVKGPTGNFLNEAVVRLYTDLGRSVLANDYLKVGANDAQKDTDGLGRASFAVTGGRYYVRVERFGYNDVNTVLDVPGNVSKTESIVLPLSGANIISPSRSQVTVSPDTVVADGTSTAVLTVKVVDGDNNALGRRTVTVISTKSADAISPESGATNNSGYITFNISSAKHGESVYTVRIDSTTLSTFPKVNWTISAATLASQVPSATESKVEASISPVKSNGEATVTVTVKNAGGVALSGKRVTLSSSRPEADSFSPTSGVANAEGKISFGVKSKTAGTSVITVDAENVRLNEMAVITFSPAGRYGAGDLLKSADNAAVYYYGADEKRHAFPNERVYKSWYADFSSVKTISAEDLASIALGKNVTYRPGVKMIKLQTVPKVYAVAKGAKLRWVQTEEVARALYGADWNKKIDDVSDALFTDYMEETTITSSADYGPATETTNAPTIDDTL